MLQKSTRAAWACALLAGACLAPLAAAAQTAAPQIEEVVVTAQRRAENIQDVPVAVTAVSGERLSRLGVTDTNSLMLIAPGLQQGVQGSFPQPYLRGVGNDRASNSEPSVATYIDGIYVGFAAGTTQDLYDVDRIEVLRGPQGTLYGRNATGGAINIVTKRPSQTAGGRVSATAGNYDLFSGGAYFTGPIVKDQLAGSIAISGRTQDSFAKNIAPKTANSPKEKDKGFFSRGKLLWTPTDTFEAEVGADYNYLFDFDGIAQRQGQSNAVGLLLGGISGAKPFDVAYSIPVHNRVLQTGAYGRLRWDAGFANVVSLTGYRRTKQDIEVEAGATSASPALNAHAVTTAENWSQELQLLSKEDSPVAWIVGAYYFHENERNAPYITRLRIVGPPPALPPITVANLVVNANQITKSYAVFGQTTIPLGEQFSVTLGGRYSDDKRSVPHVSVFNALTGTTSSPVINSPAKWSKFTYKASLEYRPNDDTMLYVQQSRGFKSGIYNLGSIQSNPNPVNPEVLDATEAGFKGEFLDRRVQLNVAAFHYRFKDIQVTAFGPGSGATTALINAAAARMNGAEFELAVRPSQQLRIFANASLLDAKYTRFPGYPLLVRNPNLGYPANLTVNTDISGTRAIRSPKFTAMLNPVYDFPITEGLNGSVSATVYHSAGFYYVAGNLGRQPAYTTVDASFTLSSAGRNWELVVWGKNLTDETYFSGYQISAFGTGLSYKAPRTAGATLTYRF